MAKTILITGASSSIGRTLISKLDQDDTTIVASYRSRSLDDIRLKKAKLVPVCADLVNSSEVKALIVKTQEISNGLIDGFVHLPAAKFNYTRFKSLEWSTFENDLKIQVQSAVDICQAFLPEVSKNKHPCRVLFMLSSVVCAMPPKNLVPYTTVKYALLGLMRSLAAEYAGTNVFVNAISPSFVQTDFLSEAPAKLIEIAAEQHPQKRLASAEDLSGLMAHLLSDECSYMTGVNIPVTGGTVI